MAADGKWIDGLDGSMDVSDAARVVFAARLSAVAERLPRAVFESQQDREHVHQVRVGTRRAAAALRIFQDCLPKQGRMLKKALKTIRRAAGDARDWDVFQDEIAGRMAQAAPKQRSGFDFLLGYGQGCRSLAQGPLKALESLARDDFPSLVAGILSALGDVNEPTPLRARAIPHLSALVSELDAAAALDLHDYEHLHRVRILGKQLRYAMEIFACCFEASFRDTIYPAIEEMQEILGRANDSYVASNHLIAIASWLEATQPKEWPRFKPALDSLRRSHQRRLPQQRKVFEKWWKKFRSSGLESRLQDMLE